jgi:hypothetical protein
MKRNFAAVVAALLAMAVTPAFADCVLRQSTASQEIPLGPFVDSTDGNTAETALSIANTDIKLQKGGATTQANKNSGGATHIATGDYYAVLDATDTDTVGNLRVKVHVSGALAVWLDCVVLEEAVYDAQYASAAVGYVANAPVNVAQISGDATAADTLETWLDGAAGSAIPLGIVDQGTAQSATGTTLVLRSALAMADDTAIGMTVVACGSTQGYCQARAVTDYVSTSDTATVDTWTVTPSGTVTYYLFGTAPGGGGGGLTQADVRTAVGLATANLDTQLSGIQSDTDNVQTRIPAALNSGRMDASVGAYQTGLTPLQPTTAGRTLDVTTTGEAGIDWANIGSPTTTVGLSGTTVGVATALTNAPSDSSGTTTLLSRLTSTRAGYLDNLSAGAVPTATQVSAQVLADQRSLSGTCDSGSTTTCVDDALTQANASQLQDRLICFSDSWCGLITTFTPGTDTATTTKVAPSTRSGLGYTIFPSTLQ